MARYTPRFSSAVNSTRYPPLHPRLLALQSIAPGDDFELRADGVLDGHDRMHLEHERGEHRAEFVNVERIVRFHQHVTAPFADADHEEVDLEIGRCFPLAEDFENALLRVLVFHSGALRAFGPADD